MDISQFSALFALLGVAWGGDGRTTFGIPDMRGKAAMNFGQGPGLTARQRGETGGYYGVRLDSTQMPAHSHTLNGSDTLTDEESPVGNVFGAKTSGSPARRKVYAKSDATPAPEFNAVLQANTVGSTGGGNEHDNRQPYLTMRFILCIDGLFPPRN